MDPTSRSLAKKKQRLVYVPHYSLGYTLAKNNKFKWWGDANHPEFYTTQYTNNLGLVRNEKTSFSKPKDTFRILFMGDSITEALQVEPKDKFCHLLENSLEMKGKKIEVLNAGVRGYSPISHLLSFKHNWKYLEADLVLLQLFPNDVAEDNHTKAKSIMDKRGLPLKLNRFFVEKNCELMKKFS